MLNMLDWLADLIFVNMDILLIIAIFAVIFWVYLYISHYSDWFQNIFKKKSSCKFDASLVDYYKARVDYLLKNFSKVDSKELLVEMDMIVRYYLSTLRGISISPGDTAEDIASRVKKDQKTAVLIELLRRFEVMKHKSNVSSEQRLESYLKFMNALFNHKSATLDLTDKTEDKKEETKE
jgi:hypothetical protein